MPKLPFRKNMYAADMFDSRSQRELLHALILWLEVRGIAFTLEDTRNYVAFHLQRAGAGARLFSDDAIRRIFQASQGAPRRINQLALRLLIQAAVGGQDAVGGDFVAAQLAAHPLYDVPGGNP